MPKENHSDSKRKAPAIAGLYPDLSPKQQEEARYFLHRYLDLIKRIYERIEREKQAQPPSKGEGVGKLRRRNNQKQ